MDAREARGAGGDQGDLAGADDLKPAGAEPKEPVLVLVGPTAAGKSEVAVELAKMLGGEIVSADSMQVYRRMDIGTAKPESHLLSSVPHHLIDIIESSADFSVAAFQSKARAAIAGILDRGSLPIVVGGSGLYVRAIIDPLDWPAAEPASGLRRELEELARADPAALLERLRLVDAAAADSLDPRNVRRLIRAVEAGETGGADYNARRARWRKREAVYDVLMLGLTMERSMLTAKIDARVDAMLEAGLEDEVKKVRDGAGPLSITAKQALGYRELLDYFDGKTGRAEAIELIKIRTRQFSKRQMTWFKGDKRVVWVDVAGRSPRELARELAALVNANGFIVS